MTDDELIEKYIWLPEPATWPAEARIKGYGQHIWSLVGFGQSVHNDPAQIAAGHNLPIDAARSVRRGRFPKPPSPCPRRDGDAGRKA